MKYNSIGEYFYKLSNRCLGLILLPVLVVLAIYLVTNHVFNNPNWIAIFQLSRSQLIAVELGILGVLMIIQLLLTTGSVSRLKREPSLGARMTGYISVVMTRSSTFSAMLLVCGEMTFGSGDLNLLYPLPVIATLFFLYWPTPERMTVDLKLKPEEKEIMNNKKLGT